MKDTKRSKSYPFALIIMGTFKWLDNDTLKKLSAENNCDVIVRDNLTNKFQPLDLSVDKAAKKFIQNKYNDWFADQVFTQLQNGKDPNDVKISSKLSDLKPIHARWIVDYYNHVIKEKGMKSEGSILQVHRELCRILRIFTKKLRIYLGNSFLSLLNC